MKKLGIIALLFSLLFFSCKSNNEIEKTSTTAEEMGEVIFNAIVNEDASTIKKHFATSLDIEERLRRSSLSEKQKKKKEEKYIKRIASLNKGIAKVLASIQKEELDWSKATYDWIDYKNFEKDSVTGADITIVFSEDKLQYEIKLKDCLLTERGWVLFNKVSFKGQRK